jgi:putative Mg2+ transporter-C (MgtC) family protein
MLIFPVEILIKLGISALLGMIIGLERELRKKPLGLKTSLVISISSCLLTVVSIESANRFAIAGIHVMDPMRLAAQIVSGIGFLGAGVILRKSNDVILGLTTAAMIWAASGLGIAVGAGFLVEAVAGLVLIILSVEIMPKIIRLIGPRTLKEKEIQLTLNIKGEADMEAIIKEIKNRQIKIKHVHIKDLENGNHWLSLTIAVHEKRYVTDVYNHVRKIPFVVSVEAESL